MTRRRLPLLGLLVSAGTASGMITSEIGPQRNAVAQPDWPVGIVEVVRHESRVYSIWGEGAELYYFHAGPGQVVELIRLYSKARMRDHAVWIKAAKPDGQTLGKSSGAYNVCLEFPNRLGHRNDPPKAETFEPTLTLYLHVPADRPWADGLKIPDHVTLHNELAEVPLKGKTHKPSRHLYYGQVLFPDGTPAFDFKHGVSTRITWWNQGIQDGIPVGRLGTHGSFNLPLSEGEVADFKAGRTWLTATVGNWLTEAESTHPRVGWGSLSTDKEKVEPVTIERPRLYHGRILFEEGVPTDRVGWGKQPLQVEFGYAGSVGVESDGYFQVCFTDDQYEKAKAGRQQENIFVPDKEPNRSTARYCFPVSKLSQDKAKAGVVTIPKPGSKQHKANASRPSTASSE